MPDLSPIIRLLCGMGFLAAALLAHSLLAIITVYAVVLGAVTAAGVLARHVRFAGLATLPLLAALLVVWAWLLPADRVPRPYPNGVTYAVATWLRIVACGAAFQALLVPLIDHPADLHRFLRGTRLPVPLVQVVLSAVIFLPEVGHRLSRIADARAAQGYPSGAFARLIGLPSMLAPLVSSLLDTATKRAEFWAHRGVLERGQGNEFTRGDRVRDAAALLVSAGAIVAALSL